MKREINLAKLAAYIDGEGCIDIRKSAPKRPGWAPGYSISVQVFNTDPRLASWLKSNFGGGIWADEKGSRRKHVCFRWYINGRAASGLLRECLPYFTIKSGQAKCAILMEESRKYHGRPGAPISHQKARDILLASIRRERSRYVVPIPEPAESGKETKYAIQ